MGKPTLYSPEMIAEYRAKGYWGPLTFSEVWDQRAADSPQREAVVDSRARLTWGEAKQWTDRLALGLLELGFKKDEMIVLHLPNRVELILFRVACEKAGVLCLPVPPGLRHKEMGYILGTSKAKGIVIPREAHHFNHLDMVQDLRPNLPGLEHIFMVDPQAPEGTLSVQEFVERPIERNYPTDQLEETRFDALEYSWVQLTTGSTGFPKFVEAPICARIHCAKAYAEAARLSADDVCGIFVVGPAGPNFVSNMSAPLVGAKIALLERFEPGAALKFIETERITFVGVVPTMLSKMIHHPSFEEHDLSTLRAVLVTGAPLPSDLAKEAEDKMGPLVQTYGSMDFGGITSPHVDAPREVRLFTMARPTVGTEMKFVDEDGSETTQEAGGELVVRAPFCSSGFYLDPEATWKAWTKDGWFRTGDLVKVDEKGNLIIVGRRKEVIIRGGQNIFPAEIEKMLLDHPKVAHAAVVGMPDRVLGEKACAYVVVRDGQKLDLEEAVIFLKDKSIAAFKLPERLESVERLPLVAGSEKIDKKALARDIAEKLDAEAS